MVLYFYYYYGKRRKESEHHVMIYKERNETGFRIICFFTNIKKFILKVGQLIYINRYKLALLMH